MTLATSFTQISPDRRIPIFAAEFAPSGRGVRPSFTQPPIVLAQKLPAASAVVGTRYRVTSPSQAGSLFGRGSPAHLMCRAFLRNHPTAELRCAVQTDAGGSTAATQTLTFTGPATEAGTIFLRIGGELIEVGVASGDTDDDVAAAVVAEVTDNEDLPVTAAVGGAGSEHIVTLTCKVKGTVGNLVTVSLNALGDEGTEELPAGIGCTLGGATLASGATDPTASDWVTALGDEGFDVIAFQLADATAVDELKDELDRRWNANVAIDGMVFAAKSDSSADILTYVEARNTEHATVAAYPESAGWLTPAFEVAAAYAGVAARRLAIDPAAPIHLEPLVGVWARGTNFSETERNALANGGAATLVARGGAVYIEFEATTRRQDAFGATDLTYEVIQTPFTLSQIRRRIGYELSRAYPSHKLVDDGTSFGEGQRIVTPGILRGFIASQYRVLITEGLVEGFDEFVEGLIIERDPTNANRVNGYLPPDLANQFRVFAAIFGFKP